MLAAGIREAGAGRCVSVLDWACVGVLHTVNCTYLPACSPAAVPGVHAQPGTSRVLVFVKFSRRASLTTGPACTLQVCCMGARPNRQQRPRQQHALSLAPSRPRHADFAPVRAGLASADAADLAAALSHLLRTYTDSGGVRSVPGDLFWFSTGAFCKLNLNTKGSRTHTLLEHVPVFETASHISLLLCVRGSVP